jgi:hypothetical protein
MQLAQLPGLFNKPERSLDGVLRSFAWLNTITMQVLCINQVNLIRNYQYDAPRLKRCYVVSLGNALI